MNFEGFLNFFTHHVESIIQWLFLAILALTGFLVLRGLLGKKDSGTPATVVAGGPSPELEAMLKQILERTSKLETATAGPGLSPEAAALADTQLQSLKKELASRDEELKALKASGGGGKMTEEAAKLNVRLKELETKLAEYEILEDDIADLSLYKEENVRLRSELEKVRGGGAAATGEVPAPAAPVAPAPAPAPEDNPAPAPALDDAPVSAAAAAAANPNAADDIVAEFAQAVNAEASADATEVTMQVPDTGDPMNDFEAAVKIEKKMTEPKAPEAAPAPAAPAAAEAVAKPAGGAAQGAASATAAGAKGESDDLFAEFGEAPAEEGSLDTDKMMAEMAALVSLEPSSGSALDDGIDTDKMAAEAGNFPKR